MSKKENISLSQLEHREEMILEPSLKKKKTLSLALFQERAGLSYGSFQPRRDKFIDSPYNFNDYQVER